MTIKQFKKLTKEERMEYGKNLSQDILYDKNGKILSFRDISWWEATYDKYGNILTIKNNNGSWYEYTYDKDGNEMTFRNGKGFYQIKGKEVSEKEYNNFIEENNEIRKI